MRIAVEALDSDTGPRMWVQHGHDLAMMLEPASFEAGPRRSEMVRVNCYTGQIILCRRNVECWVRTDELHVLYIAVSDAVLTATGDTESGDVELRKVEDLKDGRVRALVEAVNAERLVGFPSGRLFLDSVEQALAEVLVHNYGVRQPTVRIYRGGLGRARLRRVEELVHAKVQDELTLDEMAQSVGLSVAHFSQMFRKSTGETPHQFVLRHRVERAKEMLRAAEGRVLDVAVACGFKTQQHFARMFRRICGTSPTEYRREFRRYTTIGTSEIHARHLPSSSAIAPTDTLPDVL